jgi:deoxycytidylate deaminase
MRWVEYFRNLAHQVKLKSKDQNTQIGAVIVGKDKEMVLMIINQRDKKDLKSIIGLNMVNEMQFTTQQE